MFESHPSDLPVDLSHITRKSNEYPVLNTRRCKGTKYILIVLSLKLYITELFYLCSFMLLSCYKNTIVKPTLWKVHYHSPNETKCRRLVVVHESLQ